MEHEDEYSVNCGMVEDKYGQEVPDLVDEPEVIAPRRSERSQQPPKQLTPASGMSYAQVAKSKPSKKPKQEPKTKLMSLLKKKPKYTGLRPGSDMSKVKLPTSKSTKKVGVKETTRKEVDPEYIQEICNFIRKKEGKHNLLMQVKKEDKAFSYKSG